ncbi:MAG: Na/Pi-cotransporter [Myxococcota bacterium]|jgi:Na/Pi-cotransporter
MIVGLLFAIAGFGLVLAGLRGVAATLTDTIVTRLREAVVPWFERSVSAYAVGIGGTVVLQASAASVLVVMALAHRGVLSVETAVVLVLGASVGSALKLWLFVLPTSVLAAALVGTGSIWLLWTRGLARRRLARGVFSFGLIYLGWQLALQGIGPLLENPEALGVVTGLDVGTLSGLGLVVTVGVLAASVVQSSTAVVLLAVGLVGQGVLSLELATALVLGANVGTTITPVLASVEYSSGSRVVAFVHLSTQAVGALLAALFFHSFLVLTTGLSGVLGIQTVATQVIMAHTVFNIINSVLWLPVAPLLARRVLGPAEQRRAMPFLARSVRRMLARLPEEAAGEISRERDTALRQTKVFVDLLTAQLMVHGETSTLRAPYDLRARVLGVQELIAEVAVRGRRTLPGRFRQFLSELNNLEDLLDEAISLTRRLEQESSRVRVLRVVRLEEPLQLYKKALDQAWAVRIHGKGTLPPRGAFSEIEREIYERIQASGRVDEADWMELAHQVSLLQRIWNRVMDLVTPDMVDVNVKVKPLVEGA